jgi:hypothetical protein
MELQDNELDGLALQSVAVGGQLLAHRQVLLGGRSKGVDITVVRRLVLRLVAVSTADRERSEVAGDGQAELGVRLVSTKPEGIYEPAEIVLGDEDGTVNVVFQECHEVLLLCEAATSIRCIILKNIISYNDDKCQV